MAEGRRYRETGRPRKEGWTEWEKAMVPVPNAGCTKRRGDGQVGFTCKSIKSAFSDEARHCGIYEWQARGTSDNQPNHVVYVGSTCTDKPGALRKRTMEYCRSGSHKRDLINEALKNGYELWVRVKTSCGWVDAEEMENDQLRRYDYAWNVRNNGNIRDVLPEARKRDTATAEANCCGPDTVTRKMNPVMRRKKLSMK